MSLALPSSIASAPEQFESIDVIELKCYLAISIPVPSVSLCLIYSRILSTVCIIIDCNL